MLLSEVTLLVLCVGLSAQAHSIAGAGHTRQGRSRVTLAEVRPGTQVLPQAPRVAE